jgi:tetratricopeptide (TPR) repeat protein
MATIIQRCLAKDPDDRYQQAADVHVSLEELRAASSVPPMQVPAVPKRLKVSAAVILLGLAIAAVVLPRIGSTIETAFSNQEGYSLLQAGQFEQALEQFQGVTDREPTEANPWDSLGEGYLASGMPDKAFDAYSRALAIEPKFDSSINGRALALAAMGRYAEALATEVPDFTVQAFLLARAGRYADAAKALEEGQREAKQNDDAEARAGALLTSAWLLIERGQYARALEEVRAAETALGQQGDQTLLGLADLLGGVAELRAGNLTNAATRLGSQKSRLDSDDRLESNWVAALEGEIALAQNQHDRAMSSFKTSESRAWLTLGNGILAVFAMNPPSRDGRARVDVAHGHRAAAVEEYRRLTAAGPGARSGVLEPRHVLALARLLDQEGDEAGARVEYQRFLTLWANADEGLPEIEEARRAVSPARP